MDVLRKDAARNRALILDAARGIAARGEALGLHAVARAADVGVGTVYRHFATVEELEESIVWDRFDELADTMRNAGPTHWELVLTRHFGLLVEDSLFEKVTARAEPALARTTEIRTTLTEQLAQFLADARSESDFGADIDAEGVLLLVCGVAYAARSATYPPGSPEAMKMLRVMFDGLRAA